MHKFELLTFHVIFTLKKKVIYGNFFNFNLSDFQFCACIERVWINKIKKIPIIIYIVVYIDFTELYGEKWTSYS